MPDPHVDYGRVLTAEGGIAIAYKDLDDDRHHTLKRLLLWLTVSGVEGWLLWRHSPSHNPWVNAVCFVMTAAINWLIVSKPIEMYRTIEIRPDCMILDRAHLFWSAKMENGWPAFQRGQLGQVLSGIYGTRFVEYLTVRRFDPLDRTPEVLARHLQDAMRQLWTRPS